MGRQRQRVIDRREDLGLTCEQVAEALGITPKSYRKFESGETRKLRVGRGPTLAKLLNWTPVQLRLALNDEPVAPNGQAVPSWLNLYASLEQGAASIWTFQPFTVPALLQTPDYAAAVERGDASPRTEEGVARRVELRMARQGVLTREPEPLQLVIVLDESVLQRVTGDDDVMAGQLDHLADQAERPNIDLRVLPLNAGVHAIGFIVLASTGAPGPQIVCVEDRTGIRYLEGEHPVDAHMAVFEHLQDHALPAVESIDLVRKIAKESYP